MDPPVYNDSVESPFAILNIVPPSSCPSAVQLNDEDESLSNFFLRGHLGLDDSVPSLQGEAQIKLLRPCKPTKLTLTFVGYEHAGNDEIELVRESKVLWQSAAEPGPSSSSDAQSRPPESIEFKIRLTRDLPHCVHLLTSGLDYSLTLSLQALIQESTTSNAKLSTASYTTPVHLRRTSSDMAAQSDPSIQILSAVDPPVPIKVRVARSVLYASEPVDVRVRIDIPSVQVVASGIRLRTVSARLTRDVVVNGQDELVPVVLHKSGKSARFSPSKPVLIKLLVPSKPSWCECITQSTILHRIAFHVRVTVTFQMPNQERKDYQIVQEIVFLPDPVRVTSMPSPSLVSPPFRIRSGQNGQPPRGSSSVASQASPTSPGFPEKEPIPTYTEAQEQVDFSEDEYDGYDAADPTVLGASHPHHSSSTGDALGGLEPNSQLVVDTAARRHSSLGINPDEDADGPRTAEEQLPGINDDTSPPSMEAAHVRVPPIILADPDPPTSTSTDALQNDHLDHQALHGDPSGSITSAALLTNGDELPPRQANGDTATATGAATTTLNEPPPYGTSPRQESNVDQIMLLSRPPPPAYYGS